MIARARLQFEANEITWFAGMGLDRIAVSPVLGGDPFCNYAITADDEPGKSISRVAKQEVHA
jgi:hypothetical protein